jgi:hypothetical protein
MARIIFRKSKINCLTIEQYKAESMPSFSPAFAVPRFDGIVLHTPKMNCDVLCYMDGEAVCGLMGDVTQYIEM